MRSPSVRVRQCPSCWCALRVSRSIQHITRAERTKVKWTITYQSSLSFSIVLMFMKILRRWIEEIATMLAATLFLRLPEPAEALRILFVKVEPGDEVLVGRVHDHHDQAAHKAHVDHREKREDEIGLRELEDVRQHVPDLLKELERKCQKRKRKAEKERRKNPARCRRVFRRTIPLLGR